MKTIFFATLIIILFFSYNVLKYYKYPEGNINIGRYEFKYINNPDDGLFNNPRMADVAVFENLEGEKLTFQGEFVDYVKDEISIGDFAEIYWFSPCHNLINRMSPVCVEVLSINSDDVEYGVNKYLKRRGLNLMAIGFFMMVVLLVIWLGFLTRNEK